jgi:hypothetical protein
VEGEEMSRAYTSVKPIPPAIKTRLDKLMLLLGSANAGEAANAAGLITALLAEHGLDWHDVVGSMGQSSISPDLPRSPSPPRPGANPGTMSATELRELIHKIERSPLNERARQFLAGMRDRADIYDSVFFSDKQWKWFEDLRKRAEAYNE